MAGNLSYFWQLASASTSDRLASSSSLVSSLVEKQQSLGEPSKQVPERLFADNLGKDDGRGTLTVSEEQTREAEASLEAHNASDVVYSVKRLLKGLASHRESSRLGFAVTLSELLARLSTVSASQIITLVLHYSTSPAKVKGQEERDLMFARLFGIFAVVRSGALFRSGASGLETFTWTLDILQALSQGKEWFAESCAWVTVQLLDALAKADDLHWRDDAFKMVAQRLSVAQESRPESLAVLLKLRREALPLAKGVRLPALKEQDPLATSNLAVLAKLLKNASSLEETDGQEEKGGGNGYWNAQVHFVWDLILDEYAQESFVPSQKSRASFSELFRIVVDETLFGVSASSERKSWGFQVFEKAVARVPANQLSSLFTPNFMRTWMNHLAGKDRLLHGAAHHAAAVVRDVVKSNPASGFLIVAQLLGKNGHQNFDQVTKSKTVESILSLTNFDGVNQHIIRLLDVAGEGAVEAEEKGDEEALQSIDARRKMVLDQVLALLRNASIPKSDETVDIVLTFFIVHGFFRIVKLPKDASRVLTKAAGTTFSDKVKAACRTHFISCINELVGQTSTVVEGEAKGRKIRGASSSGELWLSRAFSIFESLRNSAKNYKLLVTVQEGGESLLQRAREQLSAVRKSTYALQEKKRAFESLLLAAYFVSLQNAREEDFEVVERLLDCGDRMLLMSESERLVKHPDEPAPVELLVDCLVGLLELSSAFLRRVASQTFASFTDEMTRDSVAHLVNQLGVGDEDDEADGADEDEEMDEDEADSGGVTSLSQTSATSSSSDDDDEEEDEELDDDNGGQGEDVDPVLRARVQEALQAGGIADSEASDEEEEEDDDGDNSSSSDVSDLDDDQMMLIDDKLADIFRERVSSKREQEDAKKEGLIFQNKILDLIEIFARQQKSSPLCLGLVQPLFVLCLEKDPGFKQISSKAESILMQILRGGRTSDMAISEVAQHLEKIHSMACHGDAPASLCNAANLYLTRCCLRSTSDDVFELPPADQGGSKIKDIYQSTIEDFMTRKASLLKPNFITDACKRFPRLGWALRTKIVASCRPGAATQGYQQAQAFEMLQVILNGKDSKEADLFEDRLTFMPVVAEALFAFLRDAASSDQTSNRVRDVIKCGIQFVRATQRAASSTAGENEEVKRKVVGTIWKVAKIQEIAQQLDESEKFGKSSAIQGLLKQMHSLVDPTSSKKNTKANKAAVQSSEIKVKNSENSKSGGAYAAAAPSSAKKRGVDGKSNHPELAAEGSKTKKKKMNRA